MNLQLSALPSLSPHVRHPLLPKASDCARAPARWQAGDAAGDGQPGRGLWGREARGEEGMFPSVKRELTRGPKQRGRGAPSISTALPRGIHWRAPRPQVLRASPRHPQPGRPPRRRHSFLLHCERTTPEPRGAPATGLGLGVSALVCARRPSYYRPLLGETEIPRFRRRRHCGTEIQESRMEIDGERQTLKGQA